MKECDLQSILNFHNFPPVKNKRKPLGLTRVINHLKVDNTFKNYETSSCLPDINGGNGTEVRKSW